MFTPDLQVEKPGHYLFDGYNIKKKNPLETVGFEFWMGFLRRLWKRNIASLQVQWPPEPLFSRQVQPSS